MNYNTLITLPEYLSLEDIVALTAGDASGVESALRAAVEYNSGKPPRHFCFKGAMGCGKSHLAALLLAKIALNGMTELNTLHLNPENCAAVKAGEFLDCVMKGGIIAKPGTEIETAERAGIEKTLLVMERPAEVLGADWRKALKAAVQAGMMLVLFLDDETPDTLTECKHININDLTVPQTGELLKKRGLSEAAVKRVCAVFEAYDFIPRRPLFALKLAVITLLDETATEPQMIDRLLDALTHRYSAALERLSAQQRRILMTLAASEGMLALKEAAVAAGSGIPVVTAQLKRMRDMGIIIPAERESGGVRHRFKDLLFRYWIYRRVRGCKSGFFTLTRDWKEWIESRLTPADTLRQYIRKNHCEKRRPDDEVRFLLSPDVLPREKYPDLTKTASGYLRSEELEKLEHLMEIEAERSLNMGQKLRSARCMFYTGVCRIKMGRMQGALSALKNSYNQGERNPLLWINLGSLYFEKQDFSNARNCFLEGIKASDKFPHPYAGLGAILRIEGARKKAREYFVRAVKVDPNFAPGLIGTGNLKWEEGELSQALYQFESAVSLEKDNIIAGSAAADIAFEEKRYSLCAKYCTVFLEACRQSAMRAAMSKLGFAASLLESIRRLESADFGQAEKALVNAVTFLEDFERRSAQEITVRYFFAAAKFGGRAVSERLMEICLRAGMSELPRRIHLLTLTQRQAEGKTEVDAVLSLFPEQRETFRSILEHLK